MNKLAQLRARMASLRAQGTAKVGEFNALQAQITALEGAARAEAEARAAAMEAEIDTLATDFEKVAADIATEERRAARAATFAGGSLVPGGARSAGGHDPSPAGGGGFASMAAFAVAVRSAALGGGIDPRLLAATPTNVMQNGGAMGEGFLVPADFRDQVWEVVSAQTDILARTDTTPTQSNHVQIVKDETTPWGSTGIIVRWRAEGGQMDPSRFATKGASVPLHEMYAFTLMTDEVLEDAPLLASRLTTKAGQAIAYKAGEAVFLGDGVGKPQGFMTSPSLVTVAAESGQTAGTIVAENVAKMYARLLPSNLGNATWFANSEVLPQLMMMRIGTQPIWTPPQAGFASAPGGYLLGRPVEFTEYCAPVGALGDIVLADLKGYFSATKASGVTFGSSIHLYFDLGLQAFRWTFRMGGQPYLSRPVQPARGTAGKSHFITLAAR